MDMLKFTRVSIGHAHSRLALKLEHSTFSLQLHVFELPAVA
jgi:hypothetical protein